MTQPAQTPADQSVEPSDDHEPTATAESATEPTEQTAVPATDEEKPAPTLLEQMGGVSGLIYSSVPVLVFVGVYLPTKIGRASCRERV